MQSKKFFVDRLCVLRKWNPESEKAKELYALKIVDLLICIKQETPLEEADDLLVERFGCISH
jgi:hypothetical protein